VQLGYYHRTISTTIYISIISALTILHITLVKKNRENPIHVALITTGILLLAYPFLSRDLFNYMFDARMVTFYHVDPYFHKALDFPNDQWLRFMHWTHRSYPYGPTFLPLTLIPSFFAFGKLLLNFIFFKAMFMSVYIWITYMLTKIKREYGLFFATHPLVIIEGLVNNHNDLIAVMFGIMGIYYTSSKAISILSYLASGGIKFLTAPALFLLFKFKRVKTEYIVAGLIAGLILYLSYTGEFQQWYILNFFVLIPFLYPLIKKMYIFFYGILLSYFPFLLYGEWNTEGNLSIKHAVIIGALLINVAWEYSRKKFMKEEAV
jgi:hypothetical protein